MSAAAVRVRGMDISRKGYGQKSSSQARKAGGLVPQVQPTVQVAKPCIKEVVKEAIGPDGPIVVATYEDPKNGNELHVVDQIGCLSSSSKEILDRLAKLETKSLAQDEINSKLKQKSLAQDKINSELNQELSVVKRKVEVLAEHHAELLLRSIVVDIEQTACYLYMSEKGTDDKMWPEQVTVRSLPNEKGYTEDDAYNVKKMIVKWWAPEASSQNMSRDEIEKSFKEFCSEKYIGNAIAHPSYPVAGYAVYLKIAKAARGPEHKDAWKIFIAWDLMRKDMKKSGRNGAAVATFLNENDKYRHKKDRHKKGASTLALLEDIHLDGQELAEFEAELTLAYENSS